MKSVQQCKYTDGYSRFRGMCSSYRYIITTIMIFRFQICSVLLYMLYISCVYRVVCVQYVCIVICMVSKHMVSCMIMGTIIIVVVLCDINFCLPVYTCLIKDNYVLLDLLPQHCNTNNIIFMCFRTNNYYAVLYYNSLL